MGSPPSETPIRTTPRERMSSSMPAVAGIAEAATSASAARVVSSFFIGMDPPLSCRLRCPELRLRHRVVPEPVADLARALEIVDLVVAVGVDRMDRDASQKPSGQFIELFDR